MNSLISIAGFPVLRPIDISLFMCYTFILHYSLVHGIKSPLYRKKISLTFQVRVVILLIHFSVQALYYGYGDTFSYHRDATLMWDNTNSLSDYFFYLTHSQLTLPNNLNVFPIEQLESTFIVSQIEYFIGTFTFNSYLTNSLLFSAFALKGIWKLYLLASRNVKDYKNYLFYAICLFPSTIFWSSLVLKDTLCIAAFGYICYYGYQLFVLRKASAKSILVFMICFILVSIIKAYIIVVLIFTLLVVLGINKINHKKNKLLSVASLFIIVIFFFFFANRTLALYNNYDVNSAIEAAQQYQEFQTQFTELGDANSGYTIPFEPTIFGMVKSMPTAIITTIFRPYIWEVRTPFMLLQSIEGMLSFFILLLIIRRIGFVKLGEIITSSNILSFCIIFTSIFAFTVGITSYNFGTLARYKLPLIPFFNMFIISLLYISKLSCKK